MHYVRAFSLPQLLIVISVIVLLTSMLLSSLSLARRQAESLRCLSNLRQMQAANISYAGDYQGRFVPVGYVINSGGGCASYSDWPANKLFLEYCTAGRVTNDGVFNDQSDLFLKNMVCPVTRNLVQRPFFNLLRLSYAYNTQEPYWPRAVNVLMGPTIRSPNVERRMTFMDSLGWQITNYWMITCYYKNRDDSDLEGNGGSGQGVALRHRKNANVVFGDGHASACNYNTVVMYDNGLWNP